MASAFIELNRAFLLLLSRLVQPKRWHGLELRAIDGSTLQLPATDDVISVFGEQSNQNARPFVMARISHLFDPLNRLILDASIQPYRVDERTMALDFLPSLKPGDLVLLDAGFPGFVLFAALRARKIDWCARACLGTWTEIKEFADSGRSQAIVDLSATSQAAAECKRRNLPTKPIKVRLVRVVLNDGKIEVLITSLLDGETYPQEIFANLYALRWTEEESYKFLKCRTELANWTGRTALSVYQDFHARIFSANITMAIAMAAQDHLDGSRDDTQLPKQVNRTFALSAMKDSIVRLVTASSADRRQDLLRQLINKIAITVEVVRPRRNFPRNMAFNRPTYYQAYKSCL